MAHSDDKKIGPGLLDIFNIYPTLFLIVLWSTGKLEVDSLDAVVIVASIVTTITMLVERRCKITRFIGGVFMPPIVFMIMGNYYKQNPLKWLVWTFVISLSLWLLETWFRGRKRVATKE